MKTRLEEPISYLITRGEASPDLPSHEKSEILAIVAAAVEARVSMLQIREKRLSARRLFELVSAASAITAGSATKLLVNDRADIAKAAGADGVHLTSYSVRADVIRRSFGGDFLIGVSTHSIGEILEARRGGADFATFGPVYASPGKGEPRGIEALREVCLEAGDFPVLALGGIDAENIELVISAGAAGFAAIRFFNDADNLVSKIAAISQVSAKG